MKSIALPGFVASLSLTLLALLISSTVPNSDAYSVPMLVLGLAGSASVTILWIAHRFGFGRRALIARDCARLQPVVNSLTSIASEAHRRGVLTLADAQCPARSTLFSAGVQMVIRGDAPADIRAALIERASGENEAEFAYRRSVTRVCRFAPLASLLIGLVSVLMLLSMVGKVEHAGTPALFGLLFCVYGAFGIAIIAQEVGDRAASQATESELTGAMVVETLCAIRTGESPERVEAMLRGLLPPLEPAATENMPVRQAA